MRFTRETWDTIIAVLAGICLLIAALTVVFSMSLYKPPVRNVPTEVYVGTFSLLGDYQYELQEDDPEWNWLLMGNRCGMLSTGSVFCSKL